MKKSILQDVLEQLGYEVRSYSGRGMYGARCLGVVVDADVPIFKVGMEVGAELERCCNGRWSDSFEKARTDNLGLGTILYFPSVEYSEEEYEDEDELKEE